jgi:glycosyltransferase involved in cell wall biosynthesis
MADAAVAAAGRGWEVYFVTVVPVKEFLSSGGRETMVSLLAGHGDRIHLVTAPVNFTFEFGTEDYRAKTYSKLVKKYVPKGVPLIVSDDMAAWGGAADVADAYPMIGVLHGDQDYYYDKAKRYYRQLSACVCVSGRVLRHAMEKCPGIDKNILFTIPCGVNLPAFQPAVKTDDTLRLAFIGRLTDYEKRAYDLVSIAALLHKKGVKFHLDIVGNSDSSAVEYNQMFKEQGVDAMVSFHGWQAREGVQRMLDAADILLLTSNSEGMPLTMMEALASGCGFTGTRVSGIEDYEHHPMAKECVTVYTVGDVEDAVAKIMQLAAIPAPARQRAARKLAEATFSMGVCLDKYYEAIEVAGKAAIKPNTISLPVTKVLYSKVLAIARYLKTAKKA